ncbi:MAG: M56 family metallopeptidase [Faecalibacterium sp.]
MLSFDLDALFLYVLNQSIVASYVIVGVLIIRLLLKPAPKSFSYALWAVVLFRLVCPLSFESGVSLIPVTATPLSQEMVYVDAPEIALGGGMLEAAVNAMLSTQGGSGETVVQSEVLQSPQNTQENAQGTAGADAAQQSQSGAAIANIETQGSAQESTQNATQSTTAGDVLAATNAGASVNSLRLWLFAARCIWLIGIACLLLYSMGSLLRLRYLLGNALPFENTADASSAQDTNAYWRGASRAFCAVYYAPEVETAFVLGVFRPKIYLPVQLSRSEMQYILLHEQTHIRRGDHIIKLVAFFVLCLHWFNPLVWLAFFLCGKDMELSCDESVIKTLGHGIKKEYSASLLSLATGKRILGGAPLAFGEGDTKSRIQNVLRYQKPALWLSAVAACALLVAAVALLSTQENESDLPVSATQSTLEMQAITMQIADDTLGADTAELLCSFAQVVVQDAVDTLNAAGENPADGSSAYYVTEAVITGLVSQNTGAATECFAVGTYLLEYEITLSTTENITLPEGYRLSITDGATAEMCTPTVGAQPYLYLFGGAYNGAAEWQVLGMLPYDEIDRSYGGPAMVANYGDCVSASAIKLLNSCIANEVDFEMFTFAAPDGLLVDVSVPTNMALVWYADINHSYRDESIWITYDNFTTREYTGISVFWQRSYEDYEHTGLDVTLGVSDNTAQPTLYAIYTDPEGEEYLFAYARHTGSAASLGGTDYFYALYALTDDGEDGEIYAVDAGSYCFAPDQTVSAEGVHLQTALDTINAYAKNSTILISIEQGVQYYTADGRKSAISFTEETPTYFYGIGATDDGMAEYAPDLNYYLLNDPVGSASGQLTALDQPMYMQVEA